MDIPTLRRILKENHVIAMVGLSANWYRPSYFAAKYMIDENRLHRIRYWMGAGDWSSPSRTPIRLEKVSAGLLRDSGLLV